MDTEQRSVNDLEDDLRATSDDLAADAEHVRRIELQKGALPPGDERLVELSEASESLTQAMAAKAKVESALVEAIQTDKD
jgi:hypothetical protein